jgi:hypothetical protein
VIGEGNGGELQFVRFVHELVQTAGAIEQRVLAVEVEMDEIRMHPPEKLPLYDKEAQVPGGG